MLADASVVQDFLSAERAFLQSRLPRPRSGFVGVNMCRTIGPVNSVTSVSVLPNRASFGACGVDVRDQLDDLERAQPLSAPFGLRRCDLILTLRVFCEALEVEFLQPNASRFWHDLNWFTKGEPGGLALQ